MFLPIRQFTGSTLRSGEGICITDILMHLIYHLHFAMITVIILKLMQMLMVLFNSSHPAAMLLTIIITNIMVGVIPTTMPRHLAVCFMLDKHIITVIMAAGVG